MEYFAFQVETIEAIRNVQKSTAYLKPVSNRPA